jgi:hypothetical protein
MPYQASYSGKGPWFAVVKRDGKTIWTSPQSYPHRRHPTATGKSALDIAARVARALNHPDTRQADLNWIREHGLSQYDIALDEWIVATAEAIERERRST